MQRDLQLCDSVPDRSAEDRLRPVAVRTALVAAGCVGLAFTGSVWGFLPGQRSAAPVPPDDTVTRAEAGFAGIDPIPEPADSDALGFGLSDMLTAIPLSGTAVRPERAGQLETAIASALQQGHSTAYIDAMVNEAAQRGQIAIPGEFMTAEGRVDTATLLSVLSGQRPPSTGEGAEAGYYIVQPGDSLAAIAYRHFGQTGLHQEIYRANSDRLRTPAELRAGLRLVMPAL